MSSTALLFPMWAHGNSPTFNQWSTPTSIAGLNGISVGPDNYLWTAEYNASKIAKFDPTAKVFTEYTVPKVPGNNGTTMGPEYVTRGPDNNMWFVDTLGPAVVKMTTGGSFTQYPLSAAQFQGPRNIVFVGNNVWFSSFNGPYDLGEMDLNGNLLNEYIPDSGPTGKGIEGMSLGPDNNLWFAERNANKIGKFNLTTDALTEYPVSTQPYWTNPGPDGDVWFTGTSSEPQFLGKINPTTGQISTYNIPSGTSPGQPLSGPGGKMYFAERGGGVAGSTIGVGFVDPTSGVFSEYATPSSGNGGAPSYLTIGPDNNIWYGDDNNVIGQMSGLTFSSTSAPTVTPTPTPTSTPTPSAAPRSSSTPTPSSIPVIAPPPRVGICHATGSTSNPYEYIVVDQNAVQAFAKNPSDLFGVSSAAACPTAIVTVSPGTPLLNSDPNYVTKTGSNHALNSGQAVAFLADAITGKSSSESEHHATVKDVGKNYVDLVVQSQPVQVHLSVGQTKPVDVNGDGNPPISIELVSVSGTSANLIFRALAKTVHTAALPAKSVPTKSSTGVKTWQLAAIGGLGGGLVLILGEILLAYRRRRQMRASKLSTSQPSQGDKPFSA